MRILITLLFLSFQGLIFSQIDSAWMEKNPDWQQICLPPPGYIDSILREQAWLKKSDLEEVDTIENVYKWNFEVCYNSSIELDQVILDNQLKEDCIRSFILLEKVLPFNGILSEGGVLLKDHPIEWLPEVYVPVDWNGTLYENFFRFRSLNDRTRKLIGAPEAIMNFDGTFRDFPNKNFLIWEYGNTPIEQFSKIYNHWRAFLEANGENFQYLELDNEPWGMCYHELDLVVRARMQAYIDYNEARGRSNPKDMLPKIGSMALPLGQGSNYKLQLEDVSKILLPYEEYISYISIHIYPIDNRGWTTDFDVAFDQIRIAEEFRKINFLDSELWITETGSELNESEFYTRLFEFANQIESIKMIIPYTYRKIDNFGFGKLYMLDKDYNESETYKHIKNLIRA